MPFDSIKAEKAIKFIESLKHTKGEFYNKPFILLPWQKEIIDSMFGTVKENNLRQYKTIYVEIPKKNGKSELAAAIALKCLFADGEMGGEIYSCAADRSQASIVFNVAADMVKQSKILSSRCKIINSQKRIVVYKTNSFYQAVSAEAPTKHGLNPSCIIFDELHAQPNRELWDIMTFGSGDARSQPLIFAITTAGNDRRSIGYEVHQYAVQVRDHIKHDPTFLPILYCADENDDWTDEKVWYKTNPSLETTIRIETVRDLFHVAKENPAQESLFRQLRLNQWVSGTSKWINSPVWDACSEPFDQAELLQQPCYIGLDLSTTTDLSALAAIFPQENGELKVLMRFWMPEDTIIDRERQDKTKYKQWAKEGYITLTPGNVIDYDYIRAEINDLAEQYKIKEVAFDPWNATQLSTQLQGDGFEMIPIRQGFTSMSPPSKELQKLILSKQLRHNGNPVLRWMADNVAVETDAAGNIKPSKAKSTQRIDGIVAVVMAIDRASRNQNKVSVYETRTGNVL